MLIGQVPGFGRVYVAAPWRCECGRQIEAFDIAVTAEGLRIICSHCHQLLLELQELRR